MKQGLTSLRLSFGFRRAWLALPLAALLLLPAVSVAQSFPELPTEVIPVVVADLLSEDAQLSVPLKAGKTVHLKLEGMPSDASFFIMDAGTGAVLAVGRTDPDGTADVFRFTAPLPGNMTIAADVGGDWTRRIPVGMNLPDIIEGPPMEDVVPEELPEIGLDQGECTSCPEPSATRLTTRLFSYGHWRGVAEWYKVENEQDDVNRYYITVTRWTGRGTTASAPSHENTDIYHSASGVALDGNTFISDADPIVVGASTGSHGFTVGRDLSASYSWGQESPSTINGRYYPDTDGTWDHDVFVSRSEFGVWDRTYGGELQWAAEGTVPTGHEGQMWVKMIHRSYACRACYKHYVDDTGWVGYPINWA